MTESSTHESSPLVERGSTRSPLDSLIASARRLTRATMSNRVGSSQDWQNDAWEMFDLVGEQRFLAVTLAGRMSQARLYVGRIESDTDAPVPVQDENLTAILDSVGASPSARAQLIARLGVNLFIAGDGWLCGIPRHLIPPALLVGGSLTVPDQPLYVEPSPEAEAGMLSIEDLEWRMLSVSEVSANSGGGEVRIKLGEGPEETLVVNPDDVFLIRVWRPHPRKWWEADSPTRSSLPVLRELVGLTMHVSAQVDSRLAGAGILFVPQSVIRALAAVDGLTEQEAQDRFTEALMSAMLTPIGDRSNASALVPLIVAAPDDAIEHFKHVQFDRPLDTSALSLRDEAIRRLALGEDAPPELLLGTGGMNHWGAWLVLEDVVTTHLEPPLALICDALTTQYLWPVLAEQGMDERTAHDYVIWYDVSDLVVRPNRGQDAMTLHEKGVISDTALRTATGFDESDAPPSPAPELEMALELVRAQPALLADPGLEFVVASLRAAMSGGPYPDRPAASAAPAADANGPAAATDAGNNGQAIASPAPVGQSVPDGPPDTAGAPAELPPVVAASAMIDLGSPIEGVSSGGPVVFVDDLRRPVVNISDDLTMRVQRARAALAREGRGS
jgi:hypothetical protein